MMKRLLLVLIVLLTRSTQAQTIFNGDFEKGATGWKLNYDTSAVKAFIPTPDSVVKHGGKYSMRIECNTRNHNFNSFSFPIAGSYKGNQVTLRGYLKTANVNDGKAGLYIELYETKEKLFAGNYMQETSLDGTNDWKQFTLSLPYDGNRISEITVGTYLIGDGKVWLDDLEVLLDGQPLNKAQQTTKQPLKLFADTVFRHGSGIQEITLNKQQLINLSVAGQFWAFLKYHHPAIAKGDYNWDAELFRLLPGVLAAKNNHALSASLETFLNKLPAPDSCKTCEDIAAEHYQLLPDYGTLLDRKVLSAALTKKLQYIGDHRNTSPNYYVTIAGIGNPDLSNENAYADMPYPDAGYRLLSLYRFWGIINYFYPYRDVMEENWPQVLTAALPEFVQAKNEEEYALAVLKLIGKIHDTHANIYEGSKGIDAFRGKYLAPFKAIFIEGKLVITDLHTDTLDVKEKLAVGDIIEQIEGVPVDTLIQKYIPYSPASNYDVVLRNLPRTNLLRSNLPRLKLSVNRQGHRFEYTTPMGGLNLGTRDTKREQMKAYTILDNNIGLVFPMKYKNEMLPDIRKAFSGVKGIIVDMRCYPGDFMPFTFGNYIKQARSAFARFSNGVVAYPGAFKYFADNEYNGGPGDSLFTGPVVVIVNATTQSQAEYTTMAFQSSPNVKVVGSTTAGADGNVSFFSLPGGIPTLITGLGVFYPDNGKTQRVGVRIDYPIYPTIAGVRAGRDELMEKAVEIIEKRL